MYNISKNIVHPKIKAKHSQELELPKQAEKDKRHNKEPDPWHGKSPGPEAMQKTAGAPPKETPMTKPMQTPDKGWDELLKETIKDWANHVTKTGRQAPNEYIVDHRLVHNFRELVQQAMDVQIGDGGFQTFQKQTSR